MNEEETAQLRSYLKSQSMHRTPVQLIEVLKETRRQFVEALAAIPDTALQALPSDGGWSAATLLKHVCEATALYERDISGVIECGEHPSDVGTMPEPTRESATREELLTALEASCDHLSTLARQLAPDDRLDITWRHFELGQMHWREWLLFARVHMLDHVRQMQAIAEIIRQDQRNAIDDINV